MSESSISSAEKKIPDAETAGKVFSALKRKLLNIEEWNAHALLSSYALFEKGGNESENGKIDVGKFIRISLKMPGRYDWVNVIDFHDEPDEFVLTVKPAFDPTGKKTEKTISHFFTDEATNNFCLFRKAETVAFYVIGLNEKANTSETSGMLDTVRNAAINVATYFGMQKSEWEKFCHHFLADAADEVD